MDVIQSVKVFSKERPVLAKIVIACFIFSLLSQFGLAFLGIGVLSSFGGSLGVLGIIGVTTFAIVGLVFQTVILTFVVCMFKFVAMPLLAEFTK